MTPGGWASMVVSVAAVTLLFAWCIYKVLVTPDETEKLHGFDADTPDRHAPEE